MRIPATCPMCGSNSWRCVNVHHEGFSFMKSLIFGLLFGRKTGIWFGLSGKKKKTYACSHCRFMMEYE